MLVVCAWCVPQRVKGEVPCPLEQDGMVSHGICCDCTKKALGDLSGKLVEIAPDAAQGGRAA